MTPPRTDAAEIETNDASTDKERESLRLYAAILGRVPTLDPHAPDLLSDYDADAATEAAGGRGGWAADVERNVRGEIGRALHLRLGRRPTWRELMEACAAHAGRRLETARRRLGQRGRDAA